MATLVERVAPDRLGNAFRWMLASSWIANLGDGFSIAAGPLLIASRTHDPALVALAAVMQWVPGFALGLYAGVLVDRVDRRLLSVRMNVVRAAALAALTVCIVTGVAGVGVILAALFVLGTTDTFANTASGAVLPMIVAKRDLGIANARVTFGWVGLGQLIGPPVGAGLFAIGTAWPFAAETICGLTGALLFTRVVLTAPVRDPGEPRHLRREIAEGLRWSRDNAAMRALIIQIVTFNVTYGASWSVLVLYSRERLGLGTVGFGLLTVATALGSILGSLTYGWLERHVRLADIMRYGLVLETFTHFVLAATRTPAVAMAILFLFGVHLAYWATTASSVRQRAVPAELQGRVGSVYTFALLGGLVVGSVLGGALASRFGITAPYWFGFVGCAVMLVAIWRPLGHIAHQDAENLLRPPG